MGVRCQLPVWSPLTLGAVVAGIAPEAEALDSVQERIREEFGSAGVILTGSGTIALALAYLGSVAPGARPRVALPAWACPDLMTAADTVDAEVVLYDLDPTTLAPDLDSLRAALLDGPTAVVVAHWFGLPIDLSPVAELTSAAGALLIDDAAQGVGAAMRGRPVGAGGDYGVLSFGRGKGRTGGAGGALLANTLESAARLEELGSRAGVKGVASLLGQWAFGRPWAYGMPMRVPALKLGHTLYHAPPEIRSMSARSAAVLAGVWRLSLAEVETRRENAERWRVMLHGAQGVTTFEAQAGGNAGWLRFPTVISPNLALRLRNAMMSRRGVSAGYPSLLNDLPLVPGRLLDSDGAFSGSLLLSRNLCTLPVHSRVRSSDFEAIQRCVQQ